MHTLATANSVSRIRALRRLGLAIAVLLAACTPPAADIAATHDAIAINVGGDAFTAPDGTNFVADVEYIRGGDTMSMSEVFGAQNPHLYRHYRRGDIELSVPLANGVYDLTLHFAEPDDIDIGERVFDVRVNAMTKMQALDVRRARGARPRTAFSRTLRGIIVDGGRLNVTLRPQSGEPVLSGLVAEAHRPRDKSAFRLAWADEFDTPGAPDPQRWNLAIWDAGRVNDEAQAYTGHINNARVEDGMLIIEAHRERHRNASYTSARVTSKDKGDMLYGRIEVRARLPGGGGTWPAIWLYPTDQFRDSVNCETPAGYDWIPGCEAWPNAGEIDIMEHVGNAPGIVHGTVHTKAYYWVNGEHRKGSVQVPDSASAFHEYAAEWSPERIDMFVDDTLFFTYLREPDSDWQSWPFDHPFHLIMNLAIGGNWGGRDGGIDDAVFPQRLEVDYVRVYEHVN